jgi:hypothetical protein
VRKLKQNHHSWTMLVGLPALSFLACVLNAEENQWPLRKAQWTENYTRNEETVGFAVFGNGRGIPVSAVFYRYSIHGPRLAFKYSFHIAVPCS